jgi:hypothetical protein
MFRRHCHHFEDLKLKCHLNFKIVMNRTNTCVAVRCGTFIFLLSTPWISPLGLVDSEVVVVVEIGTASK